MPDDKLKIKAERLYIISNYFTTNRIKLAYMNAAEIMYPLAKADENDYSKSSLNKLKVVFSEEKKTIHAENVKIDMKAPAPFYDELHFANYE